jgi:hypothetical protein
MLVVEIDYPLGSKSLHSCHKRFFNSAFIMPAAFEQTIARPNERVAIRKFDLTSRPSFSPITPQRSDARCPLN